MAERKEHVAASIVQAREHLEHALAALERLPALDPSTVACAAHALNNYLTLAGGTVELLLAALATHPDQQVHTWLHGLHHGTTLMTHTVSQLMSTAPTQHAALRFEPVQLSVLAQRLCHYYDPIAARKDLRILFSVNDAVPPIWTDRVVASAILDNLLSNAVKFSPPGKRIWVHVQGDGPSALCCVQDEGPGLSPAEHARLFQRGVRLSPQPTGGEPSMGYGLAVAKELAEQLGGELWCITAPQQGACFSLRLPAYQAKRCNQKTHEGTTRGQAEGWRWPVPLAPRASANVDVDPCLGNEPSQGAAAVERVERSRTAYACMPFLAMPTPKRVASHRSGLLIRNFCARIASAEALIHQARRAMARQRYLQIVCAWCQQTIRWQQSEGAARGGRAVIIFALPVLRTCLGS